MMDRKDIEKKADNLKKLDERVPKFLSNIEGSRKDIYTKMEVFADAHSYCCQSSEIS